MHTEIELFPINSSPVTLWPCTPPWQHRDLDFVLTTKSCESYSVEASHMHSFNNTLIIQTSLWSFVEVCLYVLPELVVSLENCSYCWNSDETVVHCLHPGRRPVAWTFMTVPLLISSAATQIFWLALKYLVTVDEGCRQIQENMQESNEIQKSDHAANKS